MVISCVCRLWVHAVVWHSVHLRLQNWEWVPSLLMQWTLQGGCLSWPVAVVYWAWGCAFWMDWPSIQSPHIKNPSVMLNLTQKYQKEEQLTEYNPLSWGLEARGNVVTMEILLPWKSCYVLKCPCPLVDSLMSPESIVSLMCTTRWANIDNDPENFLLLYVCGL